MDFIKKNKFITLLGIVLLILLPFLLKIQILEEHLGIYYKLQELYFSNTLEMKDGLIIYYTLLGIIVNGLVLMFYLKSHYDVNIVPKLNIRLTLEKNFIQKKEMIETHKNLLLHQLKVLTEENVHPIAFHKDSLFFSDIFNKELLIKLFLETHSYDYLNFLEELSYVDNKINWSNIDSKINPNIPYKVPYRSHYLDEISKKCPSVNLELFKNIHEESLLTYEKYCLLKDEIEKIENSTVKIDIIMFFHYFLLNYRIFLARKSHNLMTIFYGS